MTLVACGGSEEAATTTPAVDVAPALTDASTCADWNSADRALQNEYAGSAAARMPSIDGAGGDPDATFQVLDSVCPGLKGFPQESQWQLEGILTGAYG